MKKQSLDVLVSKTLEYLNKKSIDPNNMEEMKNLSRNTETAFTGICLKIFGNKDYLKVLNLRKMWIKDTHGKEFISSS